jgi:hypothetical protein
MNTRTGVRALRRVVLLSIATAVALLTPMPSPASGAESNGVRVLTAADVLLAGGDASTAAAVVQPSAAQIDSAIAALPGPGGGTVDRVLTFTANGVLVAQAVTTPNQSTISVFTLPSSLDSAATVFDQTLARQSDGSLVEVLRVPGAEPATTYSSPARAAGADCSLTCDAMRDAKNVVEGQCLPSAAGNLVGLYFAGFVNGDTNLACAVMWYTFFTFRAMTCTSLNCSPGTPLVEFESIACDIPGCSIGLESENSSGYSQSSLQSHITWWRDRTAALRPDGGYGQTWTNAYSLGALPYTLELGNDYVRHYKFRLDGDPYWWTQCTDSVYITMVVYFQDGSYRGLPAKRVGKKYDLIPCGVTPP